MNLLWIIFPVLLLASGCSEKQDKPNVLIILVDDVGWGDIGYNSPGKVYTPNLDQLAANGAIFTQHYSMPQCTPTRIAIFTGRYPGRFSKEACQAVNFQVFPVGTPTLATMFKAEGYNTYLCGKWHMGSDPDNGPNYHGFDESYGSLAGAVGMYDHRYNRRYPEYEQTWHRNHELIEGNEDGVHTTDLVTRDAQRIIRKDQDAPFFLYLAYHAAHTPLDERGEFADQPTELDTAANRWINEDRIKWFNDPEGKIQSEQHPDARLFLAVMNHLDHAIGEVISTLEETGKLENTLILFSSDNGPQVFWKGDVYPYDLRVKDFNQPIPMKGSKCDVWEGGIHVPGFAYWKGRIEPGTKIDDAIHVVDWFPTLASMIGHRGSEQHQLDGKDLGEVIFKGKKLESRDLYWIWNQVTNRWALRYEDWKIVKYGTEQPQEPGDWQLFNIKDDKMEKNNLASEHPEVLAKLHAMFMVQRAKDTQHSYRIKK